MIIDYYIRGQIQKIPAFRVTRSHMNILVKPMGFFYFFRGKIVLRILKGISPFKMHKIIFFQEKN